MTFDPDTLCLNFATLPKMGRIKILSVFPLTKAYGIRIQQAHHANPKKSFNAPPP